MPIVHMPNKNNTNENNSNFALGSCMYKLNVISHKRNFKNQTYLPTLRSSFVI